MRDMEAPKMGASVPQNASFTSLRPGIFPGTREKCLGIRKMAFRHLKALFDTSCEHS